MSDASKGFGRRWTRIFRPDARAEIEEELAFHVEARVREYMARGMDEDAARGATAERLGRLEGVREECTSLLTAERRTEARRDWLHFSWLDVKLGARMLVKYPGLTVVGTLAIAFGIAIGAGGFELVRQLVAPTMPFEGGERLVAIRYWNVAENDAATPALYDFDVWRSELRSVEDVGAYRPREQNLIIDGGSEPVQLAEISASAFEITGVPPLLGRTLLKSDEAHGAPAVIVIGEDVWRARFGADPNAMGQTVRVGHELATVVGVMPEDFRFPLVQRAWVPLRLDPLAYAPGEGPAVRVFGRLARGATLEQAEAELRTLGRLASAELPDSHEHLRPQIMPYAQSFFPAADALLLRAGLYSSNIFFLLFLILICANVAALIYARTATRESEIVVRNALGASRRRILGQLFAEALVLGLAGAIVGLVLAGVALRWTFGLVELEMLEDGVGLPFWMSARLSPLTIAYALVLTVLAAFVAGVLPAQKITNRLGMRLRALGSGGDGQFGGIWTFVIVAQTALSIIFVAFGVYTVVRATQIASKQAGFAADEYLSARLVLGSDGTDAASRPARFAAARDELEQRLLREPGVTGVTFADPLPGLYHERSPTQIEPLAPDTALVQSRWVQPAAVEVDFFREIGARIISGRDFHPADADSSTRVVIVNESFVQHLLGGRNALGRRLRFMVSETAENAWGPWHEIVGVIQDVAMTNNPELPHGAGVYRPLASVPQLGSVHAVVHMRGEPDAFTQRLRTVVAETDPALRMYNIKPLDEVARSELPFYLMWVKILAVASGLALLLSLAAIYSVMSFTVARRTREIGIRIALGASARGIVLGTLKRPLLQGALGVAVGVGLLVAVGGGIRTLRFAGVVATFSTIMFAVIMLAAIVPIRRALRIQPTEALRMD